MSTTTASTTARARGARLRAGRRLRLRGREHRRPALAGADVVPPRLGDVVDEASARRVRRRPSAAPRRASPRRRRRLRRDRRHRGGIARSRRLSDPRRDLRRGQHRRRRAGADRGRAIGLPPAGAPATRSQPRSGDLGRPARAAVVGLRAASGRPTRRAQHHGVRRPVRPAGARAASRLPAASDRDGHRGRPASAPPPAHGHDVHQHRHRRSLRAGAALRVRGVRARWSAPGPGRSLHPRAARSSAARLRDRDRRAPRPASH